MISSEEIQKLLSDGGATIVDQDGDKIGKLGQVYLDDQSGNPEWATASGGMFGGSDMFVPLAEATLSGDEITVPFDKDEVKDAPRINEPDEHISKEQEAELYRYYGMTQTDSTSQEQQQGRQQGQQQDRQQDRSRKQEQVGRDTSGPTTDEAMTRSEEQLDVGTKNVESGTARLRKFVVTEQQTATVPVTHEEARIEREPITDANRSKAMDGPEIFEGEHEVTLHEEQVVMEKKTVPVERVKLDKETVTEEQQVTEQVRKEQIEPDTSEVDANGQAGRRD